MVTFLTDEGLDQKLSHNFLAASGLRCRLERDFLHRLDNTFNNAMSKSGFSDTVAKCVFLSRVNRAPFASAANSHLKAELLLQLRDVGVTDPRVLQAYEAGFLFDKRQTLPEVDSFHDDMLAGAETISQKTEGASWRFSVPIQIG